MPSIHKKATSSKESSPRLNGASTASTSLAGLTEMVKEIELERDEYLAELQNRARLVNDLCKTALALKVVATRITTGRCTDTDMGRIQPPPIHMRRHDGLTPALDYIKDAMSIMRPILIDLYTEKVIREKDHKSLSDTIAAARRVPRPDLEESLHPALSSAQMATLIEGFTIEEEE